MPITSKQKDQPSGETSHKDMGEESTTQYYDMDYGDEMCNKSGVIKFGSIATPIFFSVVIALSLVGNILVLAILALYENLRSLTNTFILNLALSDLVFTFGLPFWAFYHMWGWTLGEHACKAVNFIFFTGFYSSIVFLTMMTIHRYLAVVHPLSDFGLNKCCYGITTSIVIWIMSFLAAVPALLFSEVQKDDHDPSVLRCEYRDKTWKIVGMYIQNVFFVLAFSVIAFCYIRILVTILRSRSHSRFRTVKLIFVIVVVFFVGWAPYNATVFLKSLTELSVNAFTDCSVSTGVDYSFSVCRLIAFSHCCLNPVFYVFVGVKFRNHLKMILHRVLQRQSSIELQPRSSRYNIHSHGSMY
ncbi:chemokine (C motif) receptor 1a, duplicate 1 [Megalops cyprinoides]|uniref:chemokine (C motif) receptor 1a, duplicate 1 n=1 Tax=Megalops cyprinoides TaxID=118141 RepID=UPI00186413F6|nr:chemokine (C motif) receptor 1a, duplicate 1 [Megalops cyprinoides]